MEMKFSFFLLRNSVLNTQILKFILVVIHVKFIWSQTTIDKN